MLLVLNEVMSCATNVLCLCVQMEQGYVFPERRRRGRKRKAEKLAEQAMAEALAKREQARILSSLDPG